MFKLGINKIVINPNFRKVNPGDCVRNGLKRGIIVVE